MLLWSQPRRCDHECECHGHGHHEHEGHEHGHDGPLLPLASRKGTPIMSDIYPQSSIVLFYQIMKIWHQEQVKESATVKSQAIFQMKLIM